MQRVVMNEDADGALRGEQVRELIDEARQPARAGGRQRAVVGTVGRWTDVVRHSPEYEYINIAI